MQTARISFIEGAAYSLMVGLGETFLVAYALSLGVSEAQSSMISTAPILIGSLLQIPLVRRCELHAPRRTLVTLAMGQALCLVALALPGWVTSMQPVGQWYLGIVMACYWMFGLSAGPVWNKFIVQSVQTSDLRHFFFARNAICQLAAIFALVVSAWILRGQDSSAPGTSNLLAIMLMIAAMSRMASAIAFARHHDLPANVASTKTDLHFKTVFCYPVVRPALILLFLTNWSVYISAPFFSAYQLRELHLNFTMFNILVGAGFAARIMGSYLLNGIVGRVGVKTILWIGAIGIIPLPALWNLTDNFYWLFFFQILSGLAWSSHELGLTLSLIENVADDIRSRLLSWANVINTVGMALGLGSAMLLIKEGNMAKSTYHELFYISSMLRILPLFVLPLLVAGPGRPVLFRILSLLTHGRGIQKPILIPDRDS